MEKFKNTWEAPVLEELSLGRDTEHGASGFISDAVYPEITGLS